MAQKLSFIGVQYHQKNLKDNKVWLKASQYGVQLNTIWIHVCCWYRTRLIPKVSLALGFKPKTVDEKKLKKRNKSEIFLSQWDSNPFT